MHVFGTLLLLYTSKLSRKKLLFQELALLDMYYLASPKLAANAFIFQLLLHLIYFQPNSAGIIHYSEKEMFVIHGQHQPSSSPQPTLQVVLLCMSHPFIP